jgi:3-deoxy-D-manno-octulosonate 8-phosphate phosphatase (KDO 8-P phosphatase)
VIKLIVLDVDGCLTDGKIIYTNNGDEIKAFNVKDGLAIKAWMNLGFDVAIITGRQSAIVKRRSDELGIQHLHQGAKDKRSLLEALARTLGISADEIAAIGDDLNDLKMLNYVGRSFTPADGSEHIKSVAGTVLSRNGGDAAVREMIELLVRDNGLENEFLASWQ